MQGSAGFGPEGSGLTDERGRLGAVRHVVGVAVSPGQVGQVGVDVPATQRGAGAVPDRAGHLALTEDPDEVADPLVVALPGQQRHDDQLDAQEHEQEAPLGLQGNHGDGWTNGAVLKGPGEDVRQNGSVQGQEGTSGRRGGGTSPPQTGNRKYQPAGEETSAWRSFSSSPGRPLRPLEVRLAVG